METQNLNSVAFSATLHCLTGCAIGEILGMVIGTALAADMVSIGVMEIVDNAVMLAVPGAMEAGLDSLLFWGSLAFALAVAFVAAVAGARGLIARGTGG